MAVLHSRLSGGERFDEWRRLQQGKARIAVGRAQRYSPRSRTSASSWWMKSTRRPTSRSRCLGTTPEKSLGSARELRRDAASGQRNPRSKLSTPLSSKNTLLEMPERIDNRPLPGVALVDMREELRENKSLFSRHLVDHIGARVESGSRSFSFERRGYSQFVLCRDCGYVARCPNCAVSLAFHAAWNSLRCHHCDYGRPAPTVCPSCKGTKIRGSGIGTERVEEEVQKYFPDARGSYGP